MTLLKTQTWPDIEAYLSKSQAIIIPIGSYEQHGPTGYIGTDATCPEVIAEQVGKTSGILIGPTVSVGVAQHHLGFTGSITLRPRTLIAVLQDMVNSLAQHGFRHFVFLNGHGGNIATVEAAFAEIYSETSLGTAANNRPKLELYLLNWFEGKSVQRYSQDHFGTQEGSHATPSEVALTYQAYPEHIKQAALNPTIANDGDFIRDAFDYRAQFPDGRIGSNPALASIEHGEKLLALGVNDCIEYLTEVGIALPYSK